MLPPIVNRDPGDETTADTCRHGRDQDDCPRCEWLERLHEDVAAHFEGYGMGQVTT